MDISFIVLNYKSEQYLPGCVQSLEKSVGNLSYEIIIINNDSEQISSITPSDTVKIVNNNTNEGFAKACNQGANIASGNTLFFINPDTEVFFGTFDKLLENFSDESVGIIAPKLLLPSGEVQPWSSGFSVTLLDILRNNFGWIRNKKLWNKDSSVFVDWTSGAAFAINKDLFENVSGFDENFFMYFEDVDLCKRISKLKKKILVSPSMQILHFGGKSYLDKKRQKEEYYASQDYYFKKHFGTVELFLLKSLRMLSGIMGDL